MENKKIKQFLISFSERTLNKCETFTRTYGKDFARQRLEINLDKVYTDIHHDVDNGQYSLKDLSIRLFSHSKNAKPLTIKDIKNDFVLQHDILHESIHAIFRRTPEECETFEIKSGTGINEYYNNGSVLGTGLNEGLTEWLCKKAGYPLNVYSAESNIVELFELAIGEDGVMQLTKGDIKGNATKLLQMSIEDLEEMLYHIDEVWRKENDNEQLRRIVGILSNRENTLLSDKNQEDLKEELGSDYNRYTQLMRSMYNFKKNLNVNDVNQQLEYLNQALNIGKTDLNWRIDSLKEDIYLKYFNKEIEDLQNNTTISREEMNRLNALYNNIDDEHSIHSPILLRFKNEIYPKLQNKLPVVNESKFAEIYEKAKENINQVFKEFKTFFKEQINDKDINERD